MQRLVSRVGSRGWAAIILSGGVVLAIPFFRSCPSDNSIEVPGTVTGLGKPTASDSQLARPRDSDSSALLTSTELPSPVRPQSLPNWVASSPPPMQLLLREKGELASKMPENQTGQFPMQPLRPWIGEPMPLELSNLGKQNASPDPSIGVAANSLQSYRDALGPTVQSAPALANNSADWPDQRIRLQNIDQLVQVRSPRIESATSGGPAGSVSIGPNKSPIQPASLGRANEQIAQPPPKAERPRHFIFQPGMKH